MVLGMYLCLGGGSRASPRIHVVILRILSLKSVGHPTLSWSPEIVPTEIPQDGDLLLVLSITDKSTLSNRKAGSKF